MPPDYLITCTIPGETPASRERIVRAKNEAQAIRHVVSDTLTVRRAEIDDAMRLAAAGGVVETAKEAE